MNILKSATVTKLEWKHSWWNEVNPASVQPKFGGGVSTKRKWTKWLDCFL